MKDLQATDAGRFGPSLVRLEFDRIEIPGDRDLIIDSELRRVGPGSGGKQAGFIAGSALGGALLGGAVAAGSIGAALFVAVLGFISRSRPRAEREEPPCKACKLL